MKINLKVLMLGLLMGSTAATHATEYVRMVYDKVTGAPSSVYTYVSNKNNWSAKPYILPACTVTALGLTAGALYLAYKKSKANKQRAEIELEVK